MQTKKVLIKSLILISLYIFSTSLFEGNQSVHAFSGQVIQRGATGDDVIELQARLQYIGYFTGKIDGVFGWGTYWALRNFQQKYGLPVDGLAGSGTKAKLVKASQYDAKYVKSQLNSGKPFTYYGGTKNAPAEKKQLHHPPRLQNLLHPIYRQAIHKMIFN